LALSRAHTDELGNLRGRAVAESSFHHFVDYNWDIGKGCPSFVTELPGDAVRKNPAGLDDVKTYVRSRTVISAQQPRSGRPVSAYWSWLVS